MKNLLYTVLAFTLTSNTVFALNPSRTYKQRPEKFNMTYEAVKVKTNDGEAELNAWYFPASKKTSKLVLIAHNGEGNMGNYLLRADKFISDGFNVVMFDYRGFGESSEFEMDNNMYIYPHFQNDVESMIDYCRKSYSPTFSIYGWGIGAGLSLGIGYNRQEIEHIIADTPFLSMEDLENRFSNWDEPMEVPFAGYEKRYEPIYSLDNAKTATLTGILIIVGSNDMLYSQNDYTSLSNKQPKTVRKTYVVENPDRKDNFLVDKDAYMNAIVDLLNSK